MNKTEARRYWLSRILAIGTAAAATMSPAYLLRYIWYEVPYHLRAGIVYALIALILGILFRYAFRFLIRIASSNSLRWRAMKRIKCHSLP